MIFFHTEFKFSVEANHGSQSYNHDTAGVESSRHAQMANKSSLIPEKWPANNAKGDPNESTPMYCYVRFMIKEMLAAVFLECIGLWFAG